jgi:hypothetical protein
MSPLGLFYPRTLSDFRGLICFQFGFLLLWSAIAFFIGLGTHVSAWAMLLIWVPVLYSLRLHLKIARALAAKHSDQITVFDALAMQAWRWVPSDVSEPIKRDLESLTANMSKWPTFLLSLVTFALIVFLIAMFTPTEYRRGGKQRQGAVQFQHMIVAGVIGRKFITPSAR